MTNLKSCRHLIGSVCIAMLCWAGPIYGQWTSGLLLEALGPGGWGSLNYTLQRDLNPVHLRVRAGAGLLRLSDFENRFNPDLTFPLGLELGYGKKHQVFAGGGAALSSIVRFSENDKRRQWNTHYYLTAGYKLLLKKGLYLKVGYTPLLEKGYFRHWGAAGLGYSFK